ncbi:unnamed protein product [Effrenium voratum]|uniref:Transmembrane protein n=1 Tax=Effrenium voratum TaxID=2562239 RepID=A0AA36MPI5_9DINO|nr:unnamed protein product [Effrenium voratum]
MAMPDARVTFGLRELWALLAVSAVAAGALQFGGNERLDRIAVFRQFMRKSQADLPPVGSGTWTSVGGQTVALSLQLEQVPLSPALLNDFETDARLPFSGEEHLDTPQDSVPETKRWSRFFRASAQLPELPQEEAALEALYLEAPVLTLEVRLQDGRLLLNHSLELLRKTEGGFQVPARLCYALPQKPGPFGAEVLGCETQSTPYVPRSETEGTVDIQLRSHEDPYIVASHLTRGCSSQAFGENSTFCAGLWRALEPRCRCFGRPRRLFRGAGLALWGLCFHVAAAEAVLVRRRRPKLRASVLAALGASLLFAAYRLLA